LTQGLLIPEDATPGKNIIVTKGLFYCNFWQKYLLGINVEFPDVIIDVTDDSIVTGDSGDSDHN